ncbi:MAG: hypothetical protein ACXAEF_03810 [Candidatus Thorarchaeota archaeon]
MLKAFRRNDAEYVVFSDYRRNDGRKRIGDAIEIIDNAVTEMMVKDSREASRVYLKTLKSVARISKMASVLEYSKFRDDNSEKEENEGILTLKIS